MSGQHRTVRISGHQRGLREITHEVNQALHSCDIDTGTCTVFVQHTSAGLCIQENADPSARHDIESWLDRMAPEHDPTYTHTAEGPDDMPAHLKAMLTGTSLVIPVVEGRLALGTWQGIYLCEFRNHPGTRNIVVVIQ